MINLHASSRNLLLHYRDHWLLFLSIICLLTALAGCSSEFVYNRVDRLAQFYIERYVELDRGQSSILKVNLAAVMEWHRQDELASYQEFLDRIETDVQSEVSAATVAGWAEQLRVSYSQIRDKILPVLIEIAQTMSESQIEDFADNMEQRHRELEKELLTRDKDEYRESVMKEMKERISDWLGRLTPEQQQRLLQAAVEYERLDRAWLDHRRAWQQNILTELQREPGWQDRLTVLVRDRTEYRDEPDLAADDRNEQRIYAAVADVLNMRTDRQQQKLQQRLHQWREDLAALRNGGQKSG